MHEVHLRAVDLNLLPVLDALLRHRNLTRAGSEVGLSQPAMSRALGRLRELLNDQLLVRGAQGYVLTPHAEALLPSLGALLAEVSRMLTPGRFDPAAESRKVRIAMADATASVVFPALVKRVMNDAPGVLLQQVPIAPGLAEQVSAGQVDIVLALASAQLPRGAASEPLFEDQLCLVVRQGHPCGGQWAIEDYQRYPSVIISLLGDGTSDIDAELAAAKITRSISAIVPSFASALEVVAATDSVTTIPLSYAQSKAAGMGLQVLETPLRNAGLPMVMVWACFRDGDPLLRWIRALLRDQQILGLRTGQEIC